MHQYARAGAVYLAGMIVMLGGVTACNHAANSETSSTKEAPPAAPAEPPPPPEPASALGSASGTLKMADFAKDSDFYAYDKDPSDVHFRKAQGQVEEEFHAALARWKPGSRSLVIYLFTDRISPSEAQELKDSIVNDGDGIQKKSAISGQVASVTVTFGSDPPATGSQTASIIISSRGGNGRFYSATGKADVNVSILPVKASWAKPGRLLPELDLRSQGKSHYGGSSFGSSEWQIEARVPVIYTSGY